MSVTQARSLGPVQVIGNSVQEINDALRALQQQVDLLRGLSGRVVIYDRVRVSDPVEDDDAVNLRLANIDYVTITTEQDITGDKTFTGDLRTEGDLEVAGISTFDGTATFNGDIELFAPAVFRHFDTNNQLIHAFGTKT